VSIKQSVKHKTTHDDRIMPWWYIVREVGLLLALLGIGISVAIFIAKTIE